MVEPTDGPVDLARSLADPATYDAVILKIFEKRRQRGQAFAEIDDGGITYFDTVTRRHSLSRALARTVSEGRYHAQPVDLWFLESKGKTRAAHMPVFADHVVGAAMYQLLSRNARCYGLPGVYSYLPGTTNTAAMRALGAYVRAHRRKAGHPPVYVLQSDFEHYGDGMPVAPDAPLWPIVREVATLGSPNGELPEWVWTLINDLVRPVVRDDEGAEFNRVYGVPMGTPLVPLLSNLAVIPMDRAVLAVDGVFYARYNDDFLIAHTELAALQQIDTRIDEVLAGLGVRRKQAKELRTTLSATGMSSTEDPSYRGRNRIDCLGLSVNHAGDITLGPHRLRRIMHRFTTRIDGAAHTVADLPAGDRARQLVAVTNVMLDVDSPFAIPGLSALLDTTTDRGTLRDLDARIARKIVQAATGRPGVRGFRLLEPRVLYGEMGLASLVRLRNLR